MNRANERGEMDDLLLVAVVTMNRREALVLNRPLRFVYESDGKNGYIGADGPFRDMLAYSRGGGRFVAFAGRPIEIKLADGSNKTLKDHWWQSHIPGFESVAVGDVEGLRRCYVFGGGVCIAPDELVALRETYTGPVHDYWDYSKALREERAAKATGASA